MGQKIDAALPEPIVIGENWIIVIAAVDPATGADVPGVVVSDVSVVGAEMQSSDRPSDPPEPPLLAHDPSNA